MGLDIAAYSKCVKKAEIGPAKRRLIELGLWSLGEQVYDRSEGGLTEDEPGITADEYWTTDESESLDFRAGSYSGYNGWRERLCKIFLNCDPRAVWAEEDLYVGKPFYELINHSDCDGAFAGETAEKLAQDFRQGESRARAAVGRGSADWMGEDLELYQDMGRAFELAAQSGILIFC